MDLQKKKAEKVLDQQPGIKGGWKGALYCICFGLVFFVIPFSLANFVDGGEDMVKAAMPFVLGLIVAVIVNWLRWSKHITAIENEDANQYVKKDNIEISYAYDKYTYTDQ